MTPDLLAAMLLALVLIPGILTLEGKPLFKKNK